MFLAPLCGFFGPKGSLSDFGEAGSRPFRHAFRFELEHGEANDGGGTHSGQVFYYAK